MEDPRLQRAINLAQNAAAKDREGNYEEALDLYTHSLDNWHLVVKYTDNPSLKEKLLKKMEEYMKRAEDIKEYLKNKSAQKAVPTAAAAGGKEEDGEAKDEESDKLKGALSKAIVTEKPNVKWDDIAGLETAKELIQEAVVLPTRYPQLFTGNRKPWKGILLYGPPGTGKSYLAKACATEASATFLSVSSSDLVSKWQGESERLVKTLFEMARESLPAIIFIDEVDSLCGARSETETESSRRIKTEFLVQMQGVGKDDKGLLVLGATNVPWELDPAIRRRFERRIFIPLPEVHARQKIFEMSVGSTPNKMTEADYRTLAEKTPDFSGADVAVVVRDALFQPVRKCRSATHFKRVSDGGAMKWTPCSPGDPDSKEMHLMDINPSELLPPVLSMADCLQVVENARSTVGPEDLQKQKDWTERFGVEGS